MRFIRAIIADRLSGGVLALLVAFMLMLDGAIGAHAQASMAAADYVASSEIICSSTPVNDHAGHERGDKAGRPDCCSAACHFAMQFAAVWLPDVLAPQWPLVSDAQPLSRHYDGVRTRSIRLAHTARGPPVSFI